MTLLQLKYFVTVCDQESLNLASKVLFVTQPALSSTETYTHLRGPRHMT